MTQSMWIVWGMWFLIFIILFCYTASEVIDWWWGDGNMQVEK